VFDDLVSLAVERKVEFVVLAGDVYDHAENDPGAKQRVYRGFQRLEKEGIRVFVVHGNHDPVGKKMNAVSDAPSNVHVFKHGEVGEEKIRLRNAVEVTVAGISYETEAESENLAVKFSSVSGSTIVGVLHTNVGGMGTAGGHHNYAPCSQDDLKNSPVNYWALGHIHDRQVHETPKGYWAYPGNLQGRSTKATECGAKGVLIVDVHEDGSLEKPRFVPCDAIRFQRLSIDLTDVSKNSDVLDIAIEKLKEAVADSEDRSLMVRLEFTGATEIYDEFIKDFEKTSSNIMGMSQDIMGDGAVVKVCHTCRRAIDLTIERTRKTILSFVLNELDSKTQEEIPDELRSAVELLLVDALGWAQ